MRWTQASKRPVVDQSSASTIGEVAGIVVDPASTSVTALVVSGTDAGTLLDWKAAGGVGTDAVTIDSTDALRLPQGDREGLAVDGDLGLPGKPVYDDAGDRLGKLRDLTFDPSTGKLETLLLDKDEEPILGDRLIGVGTHSVVVRAASGNGANAGSSGDLSKMSRDELYELAQRRDVPGRSDMTKDELVRALRS
jgi:sporulation protein YlmC with PRC-barrel domain